MMNNRTKTLWLPALASLTGSMAWRLILQRSFPPSETLFEPRRAPASLPTSLARRLAIVWCIKRLFVPSRRRRPIDWPYRGAVSLDRDDPALDSISDQDESSISAPVVWPALRCAELDCFTGYRPIIGRVVSAEHPNQEKNMNTRTMNTRTRTFWIPALVSLTAAMACLTISTLGGLEPRFVARGWATFCGLHPLAYELAVVWRRWRILISPRRRRTPGVPRCRFVSCHCDDELGGLSHNYRQIRLCQAPVGLFLDRSAIRFHSSRRWQCFWEQRPSRRLAVLER